ncbi:hypothetical protein B296_00057138, partial [Ensete ventricosum]
GHDHRRRLPLPADSPLRAGCRGYPCGLAAAGRPFTKGTWPQSVAPLHVARSWLVTLVDGLAMVGYPFPHCGTVTSKELVGPLMVVLRWGSLPGELVNEARLGNEGNDSLHHFGQRLNLVSETEECLNRDDGVSRAPS